MALGPSNSRFMVGVIGALGVTSRMQLGENELYEITPSILATSISAFYNSGMTVSWLCDEDGG